MKNYSQDYLRKYYGEQLPKSDYAPDGAFIVMLAMVFICLLAIAVN